MGNREGTDGPEGDGHVGIQTRVDRRTDPRSGTGPENRLLLRAPPQHARFGLDYRRNTAGRGRGQTQTV